jgi:hypothetical protein
VVGELEQLALGLKVLVEQVHLGARGEPLELGLRRPEVQRQRLGVHRGLTGHARPEQQLRLAHLIEVRQQRPHQGDDAHRHQAEEHRAPQALVRLAPGR